MQTITQIEEISRYMPDHGSYSMRGSEDGLYCEFHEVEKLDSHYKDLIANSEMEISSLRHVDRTNADLVTQANRLDVMCIEKSALIQKLKNDVEILTDRRNKLIADKSETVSALWNLVNSLPPSLQCIDFPHHEDDVHFGPCHKVAKYMESKEKAEEIINKFTRKSKA